MTKSALLLEAARRFDWAYVPSLYKFEYEGEKIRSFMRRSEAVVCPADFHSAVVNDFDNAPRRCGRSCRLYRPCMSG